MRNENHHHHHYHHYDGKNRNRDSYAYHAGEPGPGPNQFKLYRSIRDRKLAGVCGGIGEYFGWNTTWIRIGLVLGLIFSGPVMLFAYVVAAILMKPSRVGLPAYETQEEERFWRTFSTRPRATFSELKHRFRALDARISDMETMVTSNEYGLRKAFHDLEKK